MLKVKSPTRAERCVVQSVRKYCAGLIMKQSYYDDLLPVSLLESRLDELRGVSKRTYRAREERFFRAVALFEAKYGYGEYRRLDHIYECAEEFEKVCADEGGITLEDLSCLDGPVHQDCV